MIRNLKRSEPYSSLNETKQNKWVKEKKKMKEGFTKMHPNYHQTDCKTLLLFGVHWVGLRYLSNTVLW